MRHDSGKSQPQKVVALIRVSTKQQDMEMQQYAINEYCERFNLEYEKSDVFNFPGVSGVVVHKTQGFQDMLKRLVHPEISGLVCYRPDRIMRPEEVDAYGALKPFRTHKKLIYCDWDEPIDLNNREHPQIGGIRQASSSRHG